MVGAAFWWRQTPMKSNVLLKDPNTQQGEAQQTSEEPKVFLMDPNITNENVHHYSILKQEHDVIVHLAGIKNVKGGKEKKREWLRKQMKHIKSIKSLRALHMYYTIAGKEDLFGGPYANQAEGQRAREVIEWGLHRYDGGDWINYMNETKATLKPPPGAQAGVGTSASLVSQVYPPDEKFVILVLAWLPVGKFPWAGQGGVGAAHTHGQATCNFKFLNAVEGAGNTFYDVAGGTSNVTDMFTDGLPHKGGCKDRDYRPVLVNPKSGRKFIHSKDLLGDKSGFIQDDYGGHSIDNMNTTDIAFSIHVYYPPYPEAWAFHEHAKAHGQKCVSRHGEGSGYSNCKHSYMPHCTATSMKLYLEKAADFKKTHGDEHPIKWYHELCHSAKDPDLKKTCTEMAKKDENWEFAQDDVHDETLSQ